MSVIGPIQSQWFELARRAGQLFISVTIFLFHLLTVSVLYAIPRGNKTTSYAYSPENWQLTLYGHIKTAEQRNIIQQYGDWYTTLAVNGWDVTFGTAMRGLGGAAARPDPSSLYQM